MVGVASGTVSMIETGATATPPSLIEPLAAALGVTREYLLRDVPEPVSSRPFLRAYADAPKKYVDAVVADNETAVDVFASLGLKRVPDILPYFDDDANNSESIEKTASEARTRAGIATDGIVFSAIRSAEKLGCVVLPLDSELGRHLGMSSRVNDVPIIRVSRPGHGADWGVPGDRQRFTVAHELGHLILHHDAPQPDTAAAAAKMEKEAHRFASAFLAPGDAIVSDLGLYGGRVTLSTLVKLKEKWGFSIKAFVTRFHQLGVIDDDQSRSLYKQISSRKWNKDEPVIVVNESAVWLRSALTQKLAASSDLLKAAAHASGVSKEHLWSWTNWDAVSGAESGVIDISAVREKRRSRQDRA